MKGYIACFRKHPKVEEYFYTNEDVGKIKEIDYVREEDSSFFMNYGCEKDRWYHKKSVYYHFYSTHAEAMNGLAEYYKKLAVYKTTESENFRDQAKILREKSETLKRSIK